jgi:hypothetical protein
MLDLDPDNVVTLNNLGGNSVSTANAFWLAGHLHEAVRYNAKGLQVTRPGGRTRAAGTSSRPTCCSPAFWPFTRP